MTKNPDNTEDREFRFNLGDAYPPDRFPLKRLTEYLKEIDEIIGPNEHAYFIRLDKGSTVLVIRTEPADVPALRDGLQAVVRGTAPQNRIAAFRRVHNMRDEDHVLKDVPIPENSNIIEFPNREEPKFQLTEPSFGWIERLEIVQGVPIQVGDTKERRRVVLKARDGRIHKFETSDEIANEIATHLFAKTTTVFRAEGTAKWKRMATGDWQQKDFRVSRISILPNTSLADDIATLREYPAKWKEREDPIKDLDIIRHEDDIQ